MFRSEGFGTRSVQHLDLVDVSIVPNVDEPTRRTARVVLEMTVTQGMTPTFVLTCHHDAHPILVYVNDLGGFALPSTPGSSAVTIADMLNAIGKMHGACIVHLVDMYVILSFIVLVLGGRRGLARHAHDDMLGLDVRRCRSWPCRLHRVGRVWRGCRRVSIPSIMHLQVCQFSFPFSLSFLRVGRLCPNGGL